ARRPLPSPAAGPAPPAAGPRPRRPCGPAGVETWGSSGETVLLSGQPRGGEVRNGGPLTRLWHTGGPVAMGGRPIPGRLARGDRPWENGGGGPPPPPPAPPREPPRTRQATPP